MKDARGSVLYVGKAQSLRSRVRSYWQKDAPSRLGQHLIRSVIHRVVDLEYTLTDSVGEALLLEGNLVKRFQPQFNVRLKDDKSYPYIKITLNDDFPRIERTRKLPNDGSRYFGPYASASSVDEAMNLVRRLFPFRTCTIDIKDGVRALQRPCLLYHIKRCQGPCIEAISKAAYRADIEQVQLFLEGRQESLVKALGDDMPPRLGPPGLRACRDHRDKIKAIERTMESQKMAAFARTDLDLLGLARPRQPGRGPAVRDPWRGRRSAAKCIPARHAAGRDRCRGRLRLPRSSTTPGATSVPAEVAIPSSCPTRRIWSEFPRRPPRRCRARDRGSTEPAAPQERSLNRTENLTVPRPDAVRVTRQRADRPRAPQPRSVWSCPSVGSAAS